MPAKHLLFRSEAREQVLRGASAIADAVRITPDSGFDGGVVVDRMRGGSGTLGLDAATGRYVDLVEAGIIDRTKFVRLALENAVSIAGVLLLTEATMTELPEPKPEPVTAPEGL